MFMLVFLGLVFGKLLSYVTKEEIIQGRKYFSYAEKIVLCLFFLILLLKANFIGVLIGLVIGYFLNPILFIGLAVFLSGYVNLEYGLLLSAVVFIYLLIYYREMKWINVLRDICFFILPLILLSVESFIKGNLNILLGVALGGPVAQLGRAFLKKRWLQKRIGRRQKQ